jgi:hypothetical protein
MDLSHVQPRTRLMRTVSIVSLSVLLAVSLASCGAWGGASIKSERSPHKAGPTRAAPRPLLDGEGIGSVKFGQLPHVVATRLGRPFGPPVGASQIRDGYRRAVCGFYSEEWRGLGEASNGQMFAAELSVWFSSSRFVGYSYFANNFQTFFQNDWNWYVSHPMMLARARGLSVGDPLVRGRRLYGSNFRRDPPNAGNTAQPSTRAAPRVGGIHRERTNRGRDWQDHPHRGHNRQRRSSDIEPPTNHRLDRRWRGP